MRLALFSSFFGVIYVAKQCLHGRMGHILRVGAYLARQNGIG